MALIDLFKGPLREVSFPGIDASVLTSAIESLEHESSVLKESATALAAAEVRVAEQREVLIAKCHTALAYARVYAKDDGALLASLDGVALPRSMSGRERSSEKTSADSPRPTRGRRTKNTAPPTDIDSAVAAE